MEMKSPPPCPPTVTVRRNPPRKARATPLSAVPLRQPISSPSLSRDIFASELPQNPVSTEIKDADLTTRVLSENLKIYLRIRPLTVRKNSKIKAEPKNAWPKNQKVKSGSRPNTKKCSEVCVEVNEDMRSVTVSTPQALQETKRIKSEVYEGFSHVFASEASQSDVYDEMVKPLVEDFLNGKSGMLAAMGPSGSGKTHTVFGCTKEPGMVPLALRRIFGENESTKKQYSRAFYLSIFEISSEKGKGERMIDLLHDRGDVCMQHSVLKGLKEAEICDAQQAESLIAHGMLKRATAMTNSNSQSSRSQCIINIRYDSEKGDEAVDGKASSTMFTIVDLAGAEREKRTGNKGARLLESNFINNTSMVFGLCLRSLLEHQKNRNKPLQKHYKNSLLTRYLQDYLEGKKRMMLILTVKPGVEDYLDTSFLLRQASPYTKIKFKILEDPVNLTCNKRPNQAFPRAEQLKKMKFSNNEASLTDEENFDKGLHFKRKEIARNVVTDCLSENCEDICGENLSEIHVLPDAFIGPRIQDMADYNKKHREYQIMQGLSKAMWTVLKQYKKKLEGLEIDNCHLRNSLTNEKTRSLDLEKELIRKKMRLFDLENELKELKSECTCRKASADLFPHSVDDASFKFSQCQMAELQEVNSEFSFYSLKELDQTEIEKKIDPSQLEDLLESSGDAEDGNDFIDASTVDLCSRSQEFSAVSNITQDLICCEDRGIMNMSSRSEATSESTSACLHTSQNSEEDASNNIEHGQNLETETMKKIDPSQLEDLLESSGDAEGGNYFKDASTVDLCSRKHEFSTVSNMIQDLICCEDRGIVNMSSRSEATTELTSAHLHTSQNSEEDASKNSRHGQDLEPEIEKIIDPSQLEDLLGSSGDAEGENDFKDARTVDVCSRSQEFATISNRTRDLICCEDKDIVNMSSRSEATSELTSECVYTSQNSEEDASNDIGHGQNLEPEIECVSSGSPIAAFKYGSAKSPQNSENLENVKGEPTQLENGSTDYGPSLVEDQIVTVAAHSQTVLNSSGSPQKDNSCFHVDEEQLHDEKCKVDPLTAVVPKQERDAIKIPEFVPKLASSSNFQHTEKPKRRLLPASSVLLKDISILDIKDENDKPKGGRSGKTVTMDDKNRTQGSLSLLNLLTSNLKR